MVHTGRADGDLRIDGDSAELERRRRSIIDARWNWLTQVHGSHVVRCHAPGDRVGDEGDALVTDCVGAPLAVQTADCAPVVLVGHARVAVAHAGWRGLLDGVLERAIEALGGERAAITAYLGPVIRASSYEFDGPELELIAAAFGPSIRSVTDTGTPALDLAAAVQAALLLSGVTAFVDGGDDTADDDFFSHRVRGDLGRQSTVVRLVHA